MRLSARTMSLLCELGDKKAAMVVSSAVGARGVYIYRIHSDICYARLAK